MPASLQEPAVGAALAAARQSSTGNVTLAESNEAIAIAKPYPSPVDWRDHWIYFLMLDRFDNPARPPVATWDAATSDRQGGTFEGVRQRLPYLRELGAGALWLTPVLKNRPSEASHHGYGIMDFLEVDPRFGSAPAAADAEFIRLIDEAHARGMYVILDIVINHAGDVFAYDVEGKAWNDAPWRDEPYGVFWRDASGAARLDWTELPRDGSVPRDGGIWPSELQDNEWFRRQGKGGGAARRLRDAEGVPYGAARRLRRPAGVEPVDQGLPVRHRPLRRGRVPHRHAEARGA